MHRIHDPIYGYIDLYEYERKLIDTLLFQRLRGIHQQGTAYLTYPSSKHDRFSHSLGVMKIATDFIHSFVRTGGAEFRSEITPLMLRTVRIICLCHDLGHGPFSHVSDRIFKMNLSDKDKEDMEKFNIDSPHELFSCRLVKTFLPEYLDYIEKEYNDFIHKQTRELLVSFEVFRKGLEKSGPLFFDKRPENPLIYYHQNQERELPCWRAFKQIINCDFDSDKIDYIQRDGYVTGVKAGHLDTLGLLNNIIIDYTKGCEDAAFARQALSSIETLILERYKLFRWLNFHHTVCFSDELMARIMELTENEIYEETPFKYETFNLIAREDLKALKSRGKYKPYNINLFNDSIVINNIRRAYRENNRNSNLQLARYYLNIIDMRHFFTAVWRVDTLLEPEHERIIFDLKEMINKEQDKYIPYLKGIVNQIEQDIAKKIGVEEKDVILTYKPYEPVKPNIYIKIKTDDGFINIRDISAVISLLEWRRRIRPSDLRKEIRSKVKREFIPGKEDYESLITILREDIEDAPQIFTPIYAFIKGLPRNERENTKNRIMKIIEEYLTN